MSQPPALALLLPADASPATRHALKNWCDHAEGPVCAWLCGPAEVHMAPHPCIYNAEEPLPLVEALPLLPWQRLVIARDGQIYTFKVSYPA